MAAAGTAPRPRILVTGFNAFPGAPLNPTEKLVGALDGRAAELTAFGDVSTAVVDVDYRGLPAALSRLGRAHSPDIAIHFGLSGMATGFTLERVARNVFGRKPDNAGYVPVDQRICAGEDVLPSALPLAKIHDRLTTLGLPVAWSDSAGDYLCNYIFYLSRSDIQPDFAPEMSGFVHVPPLAGDAGADGGGGTPMSLDRLVAGGLAIIEACAAEWRRTARE